jgi:hypothetical protein
MSLERSLGHAEEEVGAEQTMTLLCQIEVLMAQGKSAPEVSHPHSSGKGMEWILRSPA